MPINAIMLVRVKNKVDDRFIDNARRELLVKFNMDDTDFYPGQALIRLDKDDELIPHGDGISTWLNLNFALRYFGEAHKKGNFEFFDICAEWLENKFGDCEIWYGSDDDYSSITILNANRRNKLLDEYRKLNPEDIYTRRLRDK